MSAIADLHKALVSRILDGDGTTTPVERRNAFYGTWKDGPIARLMDKVAYRPYEVTDEDILTALTSGFSEDQLFELIVCAAVGQASRMYIEASEVVSDAAGEG